MRTQVRKRLGDATSAFWTDDELNGYINDGLRDISFRTKCLINNTYISSISCDPNTDSQKSNEYTLTSISPNLYSILRVYYLENGSEWIRLEPSSREELDEESISWRGNVGLDDSAGSSGQYNYNSKTATPRDYYWNREENLFGIDPPPNDENAGTNYIRIYYVDRHTDISGDTDEPLIPEPMLHLAAINYAVAVGFEDRGWGDRANDMWTKYYQRLKDYKVERNREREDDEIVSMNYRTRSYRNRSSRS
jgi:hypothetical protein